MTSGLCGYENNEFGDDGWGLVCELSKGHDGDHRVTLTWATRPADVCKAEGHVWGEWQAYTETRPSLFSHWRDWAADPIRWRLCARCKHHDFEGGRRNPDISDILLKALHPGPIVIPDVSGEVKVRISEFKI